MEITASPPLPKAMKPLHFATSKELGLDSKLGPATAATARFVPKACSLKRVQRFLAFHMFISRMCKAGRWPSLLCLPQHRRNKNE